MSAPELPALMVETVECDDLGSLAELLDERDPLLWTRHGFGIGGIGTAVRLEFRGPDRVVDAAAAWRTLAAKARITDPLGFPGTGLIAFGSFTFAGDSGISSVLIVPSIVVGRSAGRRWITRIGVGGVAALELPPSRGGCPPRTTSPRSGRP